MNTCNKGHAASHTVLAALSTALLLAAGTAHSTDFNFTLDTQFDSGTLNGVNHTTPHPTTISFSSTPPAPPSRYSGSPTQAKIPSPASTPIYPPSSSPAVAVKLPVTAPGFSNRFMVPGKARPHLELRLILTAMFISPTAILMAARRR